MSKLTLVYGGLYGSCGKGQLCAAIGRDEKVDYAVRVGGPNAGHTVTAVDGRVVKAQQVPVLAFTQEGVVPVIGASGLILPEVLDRELDILFDLWGYDPTIYIDKLAGVITEAHQAQETELKKSIGSTGEGVGAATAERVMRRAPVIEDLWEDLCDQYHHWTNDIVLVDSVEMLNKRAERADATHVLIEGTQGYLLSLNTSGYYPFATSRDCGPEAIMGQVGLSFRAFDEVEVVCVMRTYPIRVGGNSGPLPNEITWEDLMRRTEGYVDTPERTTVTKKIRRVAEFDTDLALKTIRETRPTSVALTFLDYVVPGDAMKEWPGQLSTTSWAFIRSVENSLGVDIKWVSTGPGQKCTFRLDEEMPF